jgi:hypothetical protein
MVLRVLLERQRGTVARWQLVGRGVSDRQIERWVRRGRLIRMHRGVYVTSRSALTREGYWWAAVLACGPDSALSHRAAAAAWVRRPDHRRRIDVRRVAPAGGNWLPSMPIARSCTPRM